MGTPSPIEHVLAIGLGVVFPFLTAIRNRYPFTIHSHSLSTTSKLQFYRMNSFFLVGIGVVTCLVWRLHHPTLSSLGFHYPAKEAPPAYGWLLGLLLSLYLLDIFFSFGNRNAKKRTALHHAKHIPFIPVNGKEFSVYLLMCLAAAFGEEVFFRGFLINYSAGLWSASEQDTMAVIALPVVSFAVGHAYQGIPAVLKILLLSLLIALIYWYTHSLYLVMAIHFLVDAISGWLGMKLAGEPYR